MHRTMVGILTGLIIAALAPGSDVAAGETMTPLERVASTPKGQLKSPYGDFASVAEDGHKICMSLDCNSLPWRWRRRRHGSAPHQSNLDLWRRCRHRYDALMGVLEVQTGLLR